MKVRTATWWLFSECLCWTGAVHTAITTENSNSNSNSTVSLTSITDSTYNTVYRYASFAALAYCTKKDWFSVGTLQTACSMSLCTESPGNIYVEHIYRGTVSGVLFRDDSNHEIIVALKGTTSNDEWLMDFKIYPMPYHFLSKRKKGWKKYLFSNSECRGCTVHKGFYDGSKEVYDNMFTQIVALSREYPDYNMVVTGHSLGGAIAPILANELLLLGRKRKTTLISFGSPKIGNRLFAQWIDKAWNTQYHYDNLHAVLDRSSYLRVSHKGDLVPLLPMRQLGYDHCGIDFYFSTSKIPMKQEHIQIRNSPSHILAQNYTDTSGVQINGDNIDKYVESHRVYLLPMNKCKL